MSSAEFIAPGQAPPVAGGTMKVEVIRAGVDSHVHKEDRVAVEAPLEYLLHHPALGLEPVSFGTTMSTPGDDENLAVGLLYGEGIVNRVSDIDVVESSTRRPNVVNVRLRPDVQMEMQTATRRFSAGSSCGVCGTTGLDAAIARAAAIRIAPTRAIELALLFSLPERMRTAQSKFGDTGGIHAAALFDFSGAFASPWRRMSGDTTPSTSWSARLLMAGSVAAQRAHHSLERPRELRAHSKSAAHRRRHTRRHRRAVEPGGPSGRGCRPHAGGFFAREALQYILESAAL